MENPLRKLLKKVKLKGVSMSDHKLSFNNFSDFYPYYINEHSRKNSKIVHFIGTLGIYLLLIATVTTGNLNFLWFIPVSGYGFAWFGHFVFEKNRPATFKHPFYSMRGDFTMFWHLLTGKLQFTDHAKLKN